MSDYEGVIVKQVETEQPRDIDATVRYMLDLKNHGHKLAHDESGPLSGSMNCIAQDRKGQLREFNHYLRLHGNSRSTQAASHQLISYPEGVIPTRKQIERDLRIVLKKYGMQNHLLVWDAHGNTANFHVHFLLLRVSMTPDEKGEYLIAENGLVKKLEKKRDRIRTDWSACRQAAVAEISELYGVGIPRNVRRTPGGSLRQRSDPKDTLSDKTRIGERKRGTKSKERQLSEVMKVVFDLAATEASISKASFWHIADREFASRALELTFKAENGRVTGGYITGPDNRKCCFGKAGKGYSAPALIKRFGPPSPDDAAHHSEYDFEPFEYRHDLTVEEAKKRLQPVFRESIEAGTWPLLIVGVQQQGMTLARSGGGLVILYNDGRDTIKASDVSNKYSLSKLEKVLGPCSLLKSAPAEPSKRDILIQDAEPILARHVRLGGRLSELQSNLSRANINIEKKVYTNTDGERIPYIVLVRDGIWVNLSQVARDSNKRAVYTMPLLKRLDRAAQREAANRAWLHRGEDAGFADRYSGYLDNFIHNAKKQQEVGILPLFAAAAAFIKTKTNKETSNVYRNSPETHQSSSQHGEIPSSESLLRM